jgi:hypothetical protein
LLPQVKEIKLEISDQRNLAMETNMLVKSIVGQMGNAGTPEVSAALANQTNSLNSILAVLEMKSHEGENLASLTHETVGRLDENLMQMMRECGKMASAAMRTEGKVDEIDGKIAALGAKKTVQERRDERLSSMEIDDRNVTWHEDAPFAHGSFGAVYRVTYERRIVAAKKVSLRDVPLNALESTKKEYQKEVALMGEVRRAWGGLRMRVGRRSASTHHLTRPNNPISPTSQSPPLSSFAPRTQSKSSGQSPARPSSSS